MRKIPTLFARDWDGDRRYVLPEVVPGCEWVTKGEGAPTRKYDGTCVMFDGEQWWARREVKAGKSAPAGFVELERDDETGKVVGWEPASQSAYAKWLDQAAYIYGAGASRGTYELCGPKVNGNPEDYDTQTLIRHADALELPHAPRDFDGLRAYLHAQPFEGIVWHHPDGRMVKIKRRDFRVPEPVSA